MSNYAAMVRTKRRAISRNKSAVQHINVLKASLLQNGSQINLYLFLRPMESVVLCVRLKLRKYLLLINNSLRRSKSGKMQHKGLKRLLDETKR